MRVKRVRCRYVMRSWKERTYTFLRCKHQTPTAIRPKASPGPSVDFTRMCSGRIYPDWLANAQLLPTYSFVLTSAERRACVRALALRKWARHVHAFQTLFKFVLRRIVSQIHETDML